jgi:stage V sporulation protein SpoVS
MEKKRVNLRVNANTNPESLAHAIRAHFEMYDEVIVSACGKDPVNQAVKGIGRARGLLASTGRDLVARIGFEVIKGEGLKDKKELTVINFILSLV